MSAQGATTDMHGSLPPQTRHCFELTKLPEDILFLVMKAAPCLKDAYNLARCNQKLAGLYSRYKKTVREAQRDQIVASIYRYYDKLLKALHIESDIVLHAPPDGHNIDPGPVKNPFVYEVMNRMPFLSAHQKYGRSCKGGMIGNVVLSIDWTLPARLPGWQGFDENEVAALSNVRYPPDYGAASAKDCILFAARPHERFWLLNAATAEMRDGSADWVPMDDFFRERFNAILEYEYIMIGGLYLEAPYPVGRLGGSSLTQSQFAKMKSIFSRHGGPADPTLKGLTEAIRLLLIINSSVEFDLPWWYRVAVGVSADWQRDTWVEPDDELETEEELETDADMETDEDIETDEDMETDEEVEDDSENLW